jgi:ABC-type sulfate/molybdate transport systems ATPase subunit
VGSASASPWAAPSSASRPSFLFDEPLSNLDAKLRVSMRGEIKRLQRRLGTTSIYVTHDQLEAMTLADRLVVLNGGRIEQVGTPLEVYHRPASTFVASFIGSPAMNLLKGELHGDKLALGPSLIDLARLRTDLGSGDHRHARRGSAPAEPSSTRCPSRSIISRSSARSAWSTGCSATSRSPQCSRRKRCMSRSIAPHHCTGKAAFLRRTTPASASQSRRHEESEVAEPQLVH